MRLWQEGNYQAARNHLILCDDTEVLLFLNYNSLGACLNLI